MSLPGADGALVSVDAAQELVGGGIPSLWADWSSDCSTLGAKSEPKPLDAMDVVAVGIEGVDEVAEVTVGTGGVTIRENKFKR